MGLGLVGVGVGVLGGRVVGERDVRAVCCVLLYVVGWESCGWMGWLV